MKILLTYLILLIVAVGCVDEKFYQEYEGEESVCSVISTTHIKTILRLNNDSTFTWTDTYSNSQDDLKNGIEAQSGVWITQGNKIVLQYENSDKEPAIYFKDNDYLCYDNEYYRKTGKRTSCLELKWKTS